MQVRTKFGVVAGLVAVAAASISLAVPAGADTAARSGDVVGVGSDTLQNAADFVFDGSPGVIGGYNTAGNKNRAINVFANGDANGRGVYDGTCGAADTTGLGQLCSATTNQVPNLLAGSVVLRDGTKPVVRPNGSGAGAAALNADSTSAGYQGLPQYSIQFARMSRLPNSGEEGNCLPSNSACGGLHVYQAATDNLGIARVSSGFNGPAGFTADQLYNIFVTCTITKWNQLPGNSTGSSDTIHPLIPQSGSGTRNFFLQDLQAAEGLSSTPNPGGCTRTVQEHDPSGIYADPTPSDAIEPFSSGKLALINKGYFVNGVNYNGGASFPNGAYTPNYLALESGSPLGGGSNYSSTRGLYFVVRQVDVTSTTPFQTGSANNFTSVLFTGTGTGIRSASGRAQLAYAGFTPAYVDCGINPTSC